MKVENGFEFEVAFFTDCHSVRKTVKLSVEETANLYRWTFRLPLSASVDMDAVTEYELDDMKEELAYQYLYCYLGDPGDTFDASLLPEWITDCWGK